MSGGNFNYIQNKIGDLAIEVDNLAQEYAVTCSPKTIERFKKAAKTLELAALMLQRIDWFVSCDDSEENFNIRWEKDSCDDNETKG